MKFNFPLLLLTIFVIQVHAQKNLKIADKAFKNGDYYSAVEYYELAFQDKKFGKDKNKEIEAYFKYAEACRQSFNFTKAEIYYKKVVESSTKSKFPSSDFWYAYTLKHNAKYELAMTEFEEFVKTQNKSKEFDKLINQAKQEIKSCSLAMEIYDRPIDGVSVENAGDKVNTAYSDFAPHLVDGDLYFSSLKFEAQTQRRAGANDPTKKHLYGKLMISKDGGKKKAALIANLNRKYQNVGNSTLSLDGKRLYYTVCDKDANFEMVCKLYVSERLGKNKPWGKPKELAFNSKDATNTHPNVSFDSTLNKEVIYFASSRKGGLGEMDIYVVTYEGDGKYSEPENLGSVINTVGNEATPFFHHATQTLYFSSSWHPGLGGYDVFKSKKNNGVWEEPKNVGVPINSAANDLYFYITPNIDTFGYFSSNRPGSKILTGESCCNDIYALVLPKNIEPGKDSNIDTNTEPVAVIEWTPQPIDEDTLNKEPEIIVETVEIKKPEPINELVITSDLNFNPNPELPTIDDLQELLPLALYFHNDEPDSNTYAITTKTNYNEAFNSLMSLEGFYEREYSEQFIDTERKIQAKESIKSFFNDEVSGEYKRLNKFLKLLLSILENGESFELHIRGFCSPRSSTYYNINLAKRRIACIKNQIINFEGGALVKYLENGGVKIVELPIGEAKAPAGISDNELDPKNSIYSPEASAQRKVQIEVIKKS